MGMSYFLGPKNARTSQQSYVFPFAFHEFLLLEDLLGFGRYWKSSGGSGMLLEALEGFAGFARFCEVLGGFERRREVLESFGRLCEVLEALDGFVMLWEALALEGFGKPLKSLGGLWEAVASA